MNNIVSETRNPVKNSKMECNWYHVLLSYYYQIVENKDALKYFVEFFQYRDIQRCLKNMLMEHHHFGLLPRLFVDQEDMSLFLDMNCLDVVQGKS